MTQLEQQHLDAIKESISFRYTDTHKQAADAAAITLQHMEGILKWLSDTEAAWDLTKDYTSDEVINLYFEQLKTKT